MRENKNLNYLFAGVTVGNGRWWFPRSRENRQPLSRHRADSHEVANERRLYYTVHELTFVVGVSRPGCQQAAESSALVSQMLAMSGLLLYCEDFRVRREQNSTEGGQLSKHVKPV